MNSIIVTFFCLGNALLCLSYDPVVNGGENAENYRYNAGASLKVQLPCNLGRGTYGAGSLSVKNIRPSAKECLCKLKNTKPESEDNKSFQYFIKVSGITPDSLKCGEEAEGSTNVDASANVKLGFLEIPCSLGTSNYYLGYWTKQRLCASTRQCLCELGQTKIGSLIMSSYNLWIRETGINLWSPMCNEKNGGSAPGDVEDNTTSPIPTTSAPPTLYNYELDVAMIYAQKYDIESYLSSNKYYWDETEMWINFIDGINESNQPKLHTAVLSVESNDEWWAIKEFTDLSFCQEYPENSMYFSLQKAIHELIFEDKNGCAIEPGTNVTVPKKHNVSRTIDEKLPCGKNAINLVLRPPTGDENAVGFYWQFDVLASSDCIDYSSEEEREVWGIKKLFVPYTLKNIERAYAGHYENEEEAYLLTEKKINQDGPTWFAFPQGFDKDSNVKFKSGYWQGPRYSYWISKDSNLTTPCDEASQYSMDEVFLNFFKHVVFGGRDCPVEKDTNITVPLMYPDLEVRSNLLLMCGQNKVNINLGSDRDHDVISMINYFTVSNTSECVDYSTY